LKIWIYFEIVNELLFCEFLAIIKIFYLVKKNE
jgi:hypothetical protein